MHEDIKIESAITFLGTGKNVFSYKGEARTSAGFLFSINGNLFHVDPGCGALARLNDYGISPQSISAILVSQLL